MPEPSAPYDGLAIENTLLKFAVERPCPGRRRPALAKQPAHYARTTSIEGPSSANWTLPPGRCRAVRVAIRLSVGNRRRRCQLHEAVAENRQMTVEGRGIVSGAG